MTSLLAATFFFVEGKFSWQGIKTVISRKTQAKKLKRKTKSVTLRIFRLQKKHTYVISL